MPMPIPGPGRNSKLTPELTTLICEKLRKTLPIEKACDIVGIHKDTYYEWMARGESGEEEFTPFSDAVKKARAEAQEFWLDVLSGSAVDKTMNPAAAFFVLERSDRKNWGRQEEKKVEITHADAQGLKSAAEVKAEIDAEDI